jgi:hypothetical protein
MDQIPGVLESGDAIHHLANGVTDALNDFLPLPLGDVEVLSDEPRKSLYR